MQNNNQLIGKSPKEVAQIVHQGQVYGEQGDYFEKHICAVAKIGEQIAIKLGLTKSEIERVLALCYLHDAPEDTWLKGAEIATLFGKDCGEDAESLNIKYADGTWKPKTVYYEGISQNIYRKIAKTADRIANISNIPSINDQERKQWLIKKYGNEYKYYKRHNIFAEEISSKLESVQSVIGSDNK